MVFSGLAGTQSWLCKTRGTDWCSNPDPEIWWGATHVIFEPLDFSSECGGDVRIIACIDDPEVIRKILAILSSEWGPACLAYTFSSEGMRNSVAYMVGSTIRVSTVATPRPTIMVMDILTKKTSVSNGIRPSMVVDEELAEFARKAQDPLGDVKALMIWPRPRMAEIAGNSNSGFRISLTS